MDRSLLSLTGMVMLFLQVNSLLGQQAPVGVKEIYPDQKFNFFSVNYHDGFLFPTNEFIGGVNHFERPMENYRSLAIEYGFHGKGSSSWQRTYRCPYYGVSLNISDYHNAMEMGTPWAVSGFFGIPFLRLKRWEFYTDLQYGISMGWKFWDKRKNPKNIAIGSYLNNFIDLGISAYYPLSKHWQLGLGVSLTHVSNGGLERPNHGLNMWAPFIKVRNNFSGKPDPRLVPRETKLGSKNEIYLAMSGGAHEMVEHELYSDYMFPFANTSMAYLRKVTPYFKIGAGFDLGYITSITSDVKMLRNQPIRETTHGRKNVALGIFVTPELVIDRLSIVTGVGVYAINHRYGNWKKLYQRGGIKYHFNDRFFAGFNIRAVNFSLSEFMEWNMGYRIKWN